MNDAILLVREEDQAGTGFLEKLTASLGFAVHRVSTTGEARAALQRRGEQARLLLVADGVADDLRAPLETARKAGAACIRVTHGAAAGDAAGFDAICTDADLEMALLELLARNGYLAISVREASGIAAAIGQQTLGDKSFAEELIRALVASTESDLAALRAAGDDVGTIRAVAHRLKSSAHFIDCRSYRALAQRLETAARGEDRRIVTALLRIFIPATENLYALLKGNLPA
ncbi:Hpt domain-containing protein [Cupriavidus sp. IDO]|uniref:Hpt domain-containing protein n=1 Tax=Cupriavidus sp. IDO TaxID=1539142 RepID=UPI000691537B|nr:Hpt domain-containing protein [Cupriavidus sp. IDO]KWR85134.1 hypothetical protein RM96_27735 [Cupriavidus sp. IDO]